MQLYPNLKLKFIHEKGDKVLTKNFVVFVLEVFFVLLIYFVSLILFVDRDQGALGYSRGVYINIVLVFLAYVNKGHINSNENTRNNMFFLFSIFAFSIWLAVFPLLASGVTYSKIVGVILGFGTVCYFVLLSKVLPFIDGKNLYFAMTAFLKILLRAIFFISASLSLFYLLVGEWSFDILPFYKL